MITKSGKEIKDVYGYITDLTVDHLARFVECCKNNIDNSAILEEELAEICK